MSKIYFTVCFQTVAFNFRSTIVWKHNVLLLGAVFLQFSFWPLSQIFNLPTLNASFKKLLLIYFDSVATDADFPPPPLLSLNQIQGNDSISKESKTNVGGKCLWVIRVEREGLKWFVPIFGVIWESGARLSSSLTVQNRSSNTAELGQLKQYAFVLLFVGCPLGWKASSPCWNPQGSPGLPADDPLQMLLSNSTLSPYLPRTRQRTTRSGFLWQLHHAFHLTSRAQGEALTSALCPNFSELI